MAKKAARFDTQVPEQLKQLQSWFGSIIERPIDAHSQIAPWTPSGRPIVEEAADYINGSPTLSPHERIQVYSQQYWWRLLSILHDSYPLLTRLFGYFSFNQEVGMPYLCRYQANHWSLTFLGSRLPQWIKRYYQGEDKELVYQAALLDDAFNEAFFTKSMPTVDRQSLKRQGTQGLLEQKLYLQAHVFLFEMPFNLFRFRDVFIDPEDGDYWMDRPFPQLETEGPYFHVLYRDQENRLRWMQINQGEYHLLKQYRRGKTTEAVCDDLAEQEHSWAEEAVENLPNWLQRWIVLGWFSFKRPPAKRK